MAGKQVFNPKTLAEPVGPFSRAVRIGDILYVSGTSALTHLTGPIWKRPLAQDFATQAAQTYENIQKVLEDAGSSMNDVFKTTVLLKDAKYYDELAGIRKKYLPHNAYISTAFITDLIRDDMLIEIEVEAYLGK